MTIPITWCVLHYFSYTSFSIAPFNKRIKSILQYFLIFFQQNSFKIPIFPNIIHTMQKKVIIGINTLSVFFLKFLYHTSDFENRVLHLSIYFMTGISMPLTRITFLYWVYLPIKYHFTCKRFPFILKKDLFAFVERCYVYHILEKN